jgi:hypothetical protein
MTLQMTSTSRKVAQRFDSTAGSRKVSELVHIEAYIGRHSGYYAAIWRVE